MRRTLLILLAVLFILPGMVFAEPAEQDGCTYTQTEDGVVVLTVPATERENAMLVPPKIGEYEVKFLDAASVPEKVTEVFLPAGVTLYNAEKLDHEVILYSYRDYDMIHTQDSIMYFYTDVEPGEYAITDAQRVLKGGESELLKQEYYEYPVAINGSRIHNCLMNKDYFKLYIGEGCKYYKLSDSEIGVCAYLGGGTKKIAIPEQIDGMTVVAVNSLDNDRVIWSAKVKQIDLPRTLKVLGNRAIFVKSLTTLKIPEGVEEIGSYAVNATKISQIRIPSTVARIGVNAFETGIRNLKLPETITKLPEQAFCNSKYGKIELPAKLTVIPAGMCRDAKMLSDIVIPPSVTEIRKNAFLNCIRLSRVTIPEGVAEIGEKAFGDCQKLSQVKLPASVQQIADNAFDGCSPKLIITAPEGSYAQQWAESKGIKVKVAK